MPKSTSRIKVGNKRYDKAYVGPFSKKDAYAHSASLRKRGMPARVKKFDDGYHVYANLYDRKKR